MQPAFVARVRACRRPVEARGRLRRQCVRLRVGDDPHTPGVRGDRSISILADPLVSWSWGYNTLGAGDDPEFKTL